MCLFLSVFLMAPAKFYSDVSLYCKFALFPPFSSAFSISMLAVCLFMETQGCVNHKGLGLALNLGMIPYEFISQSSVFKKKKKSYLLKISFSLVWSVWLACGKSVDFPVLFIKICKTSLFNNFYLAWTVVFLEQYREIRQKTRVVLTDKY